MQKESAQRHRWMLPFTQEVDLPAIDAALRLAEAGNLTLVAASLIAPFFGWRSRRVRLELIQQSKDFLEAVRYKALRLAVPVEWYEGYTSDALADLVGLIHDLNCEGMILASRGDRALFLSSKEIQYLLIYPPTSLVLLRLPARQSASLRHWWKTWLLSWQQHLYRQQKDAADENFPLPCGVVRNAGEIGVTSGLRSEKEI